MCENISMILFVIIYCIGMILSFAGNFIFIKLQLRNCIPIIAQVIYFDEVSFIKGGCKVTIVSYASNGSQKDAVLERAKNDKIGEKIKIITDGKIAVRQEVVLKENQSVGISITLLIGILILIKYFGSNVEIVIALIFLIVIMLILVALYPLFYRAYDREIKEKLGWKNR